MGGAEALSLLGLGVSPPLAEQEEAGGEDTAGHHHQPRRHSNDHHHEVTLTPLTDLLQSDLTLRCPLLRQAVGVGQEGEGRPRSHLVLHKKLHLVASPSLQTRQLKVRGGAGDDLGEVTRHVGQPGHVLELLGGDVRVRGPARDVERVPGLVHHLAVGQQAGPED